MKLIFLASASLLVFLTSCKKEPDPIEGCTDTSAVNYQSDAEKDNGVCKYESSVIFWINANSSANFQNNMINSIDVYVDDKKIGTMSTTSNQLTTPDCYTVGITHLLDLKDQKSQLISYKIIYEGFGPPNTENPVVYAEGTLQLEGGKCLPFLIQ